MSRPDDRRLPVGLLFVAVAVIAVVAAARWLGSTSPSTGAESSPSASPSAATAAAPSATPDAPDPTVSASTGPSAMPLPGNGDCGRISPTACARAIALARKGHPDTAGASRVVVDDTCPPFPTICDRLYPFDSIVVFVTAGGDTTGWYYYRVVGVEPDKPTKTLAWEGDIPNHVVEQLRAPQPSP